MGNLLKNERGRIRACQWLYALVKAKLLKVTLLLTIVYLVIMPRCACASEVYGSVFVCVCVCACLCRLLQLLKDQRSASKGFL